MTISLPSFPQGIFFLYRDDCFLSFHKQDEMLQLKTKLKTIPTMRINSFLFHLKCRGSNPSLACAMVSTLPLN